MVIDASAATALCLSDAGFTLLSKDLQAPILVRSEVLAAIRGMEWREEISTELAEVGVGRLLQAPIRLIRRADVLREARRWSRTLGWAKTYDAEYLALACLEKDSLLTVDARLARRISEIVEVLTPADL